MTDWENDEQEAVYQAVLKRGWKPGKVIDDWRSVVRCCHVETEFVFSAPAQTIEFSHPQNRNDFYPSDYKRETK